jgi:hypothetical protein
MLHTGTLLFNFIESKFYISLTGMVGLSTAKKWNLKEFKFTCGDATDPGKVTKIECVVCSKFYHENERVGKTTREGESTSSKMDEWE